MRAAAPARRRVPSGTYPIRCGRARTRAASARSSGPPRPHDASTPRARALKGVSMAKPVESAPKLDLLKSMTMLDDAQRLTPGGVGGIRRPYNFVVGEYPVFISHGHGGHIVDVDGNEYIDMLCAYGPIILGYVEDEINDAAKAQMDKGFCFSLVQPLQNELEQRLADIMPCGEQTILVKTGSDATNAAVRAMRAYTGRDKIARCGYHGWGDWCVEHHGGVPEAVWRAHQGVRVRRHRRSRARVRREPRRDRRGHHHAGRPSDGQADHRPAARLPRGRQGADAQARRRAHLRRDPHRLPRQHGRRQRALRRHARPHHGRQGDGQRLLHRGAGGQARGAAASTSRTPSSAPRTSPTASRWRPA